MSESQMRTAIITGASRGIGKGIALALAKEHFNVVVNYAKNAEAAENVKREIESSGGRAHLVQADISVAADREKLTVPAPASIDGVEIKGDDWTLQVAPGWTVRPGKRKGDFELVRKN